jgi:hypothetical protein
MNKWLTYAIVLDLLKVAYIQFEIVLTKLQKVVSKELKCLCSKAATVLPG